MKKSEALVVLVLSTLIIMSAAQITVDPALAASQKAQQVAQQVALAKEQAIAAEFVANIQSSARSCQGQVDGECQINPPKLRVKVTPSLISALKDYASTLPQTTHADFVAAEAKIKNDLVSNQGLPQQEVDRLQAASQSAQAQIPSNLRALFSANNQHPSIDEANILAYEGNYLYIVQYNNFYVVEALGTSLSFKYTQALPSNSYGINCVVNNGFIGLTLQQYNFGAEVRVNIYQNNAGTITSLNNFTREGYFVSAREYNGKLSVVVQDYTINDLCWDVNGVPTCPPQIMIGASWTGLGTWTRDIITIDLAVGVSYSMATYILCDPAQDSSYMSPTGKWIISSVDYSGSFPNTILQRIDSTAIQTQFPDWNPIKNAYINSQHRIDEYAGCNVRVAAMYYTGVAWRLKLLSLNCATFLTDYTSLIGPSLYPLATRWVANFIYVSYQPNFFSSGLVYKMSQGLTSFSVVNWISHPQTIYSLYEYGPSNLIGLGYNYQSSPNYQLSALLYSTSANIYQMMDYNIDPNFPTPSWLFSDIYEWSHQAVHVDFQNSKVIFPIYSGGPEPFTANGFYYLHVQISPTCMFHPPTSTCIPSGAAPSKTIPLFGTVYKHWDMPMPILSAPSEGLLRTAAVQQGPFKFLYTMSYCQLQARPQPSPPTSITLTPSGSAILDLCP